MPPRVPASIVAPALIAQPAPDHQVYPTATCGTIRASTCWMCYTRPRPRRSRGH